MTQTLGSYTFILLTNTVTSIPHSCSPGNSISMSAISKSPSPVTYCVPPSTECSHPAWHISCATLGESTEAGSSSSSIERLAMLLGILQAAQDCNTVPLCNAGYNHIKSTWYSIHGGIITPPTCLAFKTLSR